MLYVKIKLLYTTNRNWKPFCNILNQLRYFPVQTWYEKTRIFTSFQLQTALESRNQHQMTWNLAFLSTFMSSTRKNHPKSVNRKSPFFKVKVPFFFILPHSGFSTWSGTKLNYIQPLLQELVRAINLEKVLPMVFSFSCRR